MTALFVPEPLRVPLSELDRRYEYHDAGKVYHGAPLRAAEPCFGVLFEWRAECYEWPPCSNCLPELIHKAMSCCPASSQVHCPAVMT